MPHLANIIVALTSDAPVNSEDIINKLIPNVWAFLTQLLAFIVLVVLVIVFAYKPVKKLLTKRQDYIAQNIAHAEEASKNADARVMSADQIIVSSRGEAHEIVEKAKIDAINQSASIINEAKVEADGIRAKAQKDIEKAKIDAQDEIRKEIVNVAMEASKQVLGREVSETDNDRLVTDFIKDVGK